MKKKINLFCAAALIGALGAGFGNLKAQSRWDYPVKPGTPEWKALETHDQMVEAVRIPEEVLNSLTTKELVDICLDYPLYGDIFAYNSLQDGLRQNIILCSNGVQELYRRRDNARCLLDALKRHDIMALESREYVLTDFEMGESIWRQSFLEVLTSHEAVLTNADAELLREIAAVAVKNTLVKERTAHLYGSQSLESSAYLLGTAMKTADIGFAPSPELERLLQSGTARDVRPLIDELVINYVKF